MCGRVDMLFGSQGQDPGSNPSLDGCMYDNRAKSEGCFIQHALNSTGELGPHLHFHLHTLLRIFYILTFMFLPEKSLTMYVSDSEDVVQVVH